MSLFAAEFVPTRERHVHFLELARETSDLAARFGVRIVPARDEKLIHFHKLSAKKQLKVLTVLSHQRDFLLVAQAENLHPNSPKLIWRALAHMGMSPHHDIFDKMSSEDTVEIYHGDGTSSFKNLKFFEFVSHTLEEVYCLTWMDQIQVSPSLFLFFMELTIKMKIAQFEETFEPIFSRYTLSEKLGEKRKLNIHLKWISPIKHEGRRNALMFVNRSELST